MARARSGATWVAHAELAHPATWLIENALVQRRDGSLLMVFRTQAGAVFASASRDDGERWTPAAPLGRPALPNPNAKVLQRWKSFSESWY
jgi:hypothetical protein